MKTITSLQHLMRITLTWLTCVILVGAVTISGAHAANQEPPLQLLTAEEAARPEPRSYGFASPLSDKGPDIEIPELEATEANPFALKIHLSPRDGAAPNLATLRMESLKSPAIDLTPRILQYVTQDGINIDRVALPAGMYRFRVSVSDVRGRLTEKDFVIMVSAKF